jgi:DNA-binding FrmR family transcriptional regulator
MGNHVHEDKTLSSHPHVHSEESLKRIINRLSRVEGHIRGIKTMVQESRPCPDVLVQIAAVRGALDRVARIILDEHLSECVGRAAQDGNIDDEIEALKAALDRFLP